jgi:hypothetical protein
LPLGCTNFGFAALACDRALTARERQRKIFDARQMFDGRVGFVDVIATLSKAR